MSAGMSKHLIIRARWQLEGSRVPQNLQKSCVQRPKILKHKITIADVENDLKTSNMMPSYKTRKLKNAINSTVTRHNADSTKETLDKFRKGKHMYNLSFTTLVYHQQQERAYQQSVIIQFLSQT